MDVNKLLTNIADFNLSKDNVNDALSTIDVNNSICFDLSSNRIGIGTVDPSYTIDISGTSNDIDIHINKHDSGDDISYNVYESINILFKLIKEIHNRAGITHNPANLDNNSDDYYNLYKNNKSS